MLNAIIAQYYIPKRDEVLESKLVVPGEDPEDEYVEPHDRNTDNEENKPIRLLSNFTFFDPKHNMEMVSLGVMEEIGEANHHVEGAGIVQQLLGNEEDEGQEDDLDEELHICRLGAILRHFVDFSKPHE